MAVQLVCLPEIEYVCSTRESKGFWQTSPDFQAIVTKRIKTFLFAGAEKPGTYKIDGVPFVFLINDSCNSLSLLFSGKKPSDFLETGDPKTTPYKLIKMLSTPGATGNKVIKEISDWLLANHDEIAETLGNVAIIDFFKNAAMTDGIVETRRRKI